MLPVEGGFVARQIRPLAAVVAARAAYEIGARDLHVPRYVVEERLGPEPAAGERWAQVQDHSLVVVAETAEPLTFDETGLYFAEVVVDRLARAVVEHVEQSREASGVPEYRTFAVVAPPQPDWVRLPWGRPSRQAKRRMRQR